MARARHGLTDKYNAWASRIHGPLTTVESGEPSHAREWRWPVGTEININSRHPVMRAVTPREPKSDKSQMSPHLKYISTAQKFARFFVASKITLDEYAENLLGSCVCYPEVDDTTAQELAATIPRIAHERLHQEIAKILHPNYRFPELHYGGPGPSDEVRESTRRL